MTIDRRTALTAFAGAAALGATGGALAAPAPAGSLDLNTPEGRLRAFILMRGALDDQLVISWVSARYYGIVEDRMDPLFAVVSAVFSRYRPSPLGGYEAVNAEIAWFTDAETGKALDTYRNPYTGRDCKIPMGGYPPSKIRISPDLHFHLAKPVPGLEINHEIMPILVSGDDIWITERSRTAMTPPGAAKPFRYSESDTFHARKSDLMKPGITRVASEVSFTNVTSWRQWLEMGDHPGHLSAMGIGKQNATMDTLPPAWLEATAQRRPEVLKDPAALLAPLWDAR